MGKEERKEARGRGSRGRLADSVREVIAWDWRAVPKGDLYRALSGSKVIERRAGREGRSGVRR